MSVKSTLIAASAAASAAAGLAGAIVAASLVEALDEAGAVRRRIKLIPMGKFTLRDGRGPYELKDVAHAQRVVQATKAYAAAQDLMVDYDHQSVFAAVQGVGGRAPASGWFKNFEAQADGIWASVDWTGPAETAIAAKEYRYISPLFEVDAQGRVTKLLNAGLTNTPAIDGLPAIAAGLQTQGKSMDLTQLAALLGLPAEATADQVAAAITAARQAQAAAETSTQAIAASLGLAATATTDQIVAAAKSARPDPTKYVPIEGYTALKTTVTELQAKAADEAIAAATLKGQLSPAMRQWGLDLYVENRPAWDAFVKDAPVVIAASEQRKDPPTVPTALTASQKAVAASLGLSEADYLEALKED